MAHSCPECNEICYCGGDIDDILLEDIDAEIRCTHLCTNSAGDDDMESFDEGEGICQIARLLKNWHV